MNEQPHGQVNLAPCPMPWCNGRVDCVQALGERPGECDDGYMHLAVCSGCGMQGPRRETRESAADSWNWIAEQADRHQELVEYLDKVSKTFADAAVAMRVLAHPTAAQAMEVAWQETEAALNRMRSS